MPTTGSAVRNARSLTGGASTPPVWPALNGVVKAGIASACADGHTRETKAQR